MLVDFHMHLLPGADHGSQSVEESLIMIREAKALGVNAIVATPHFYPENHSADRFIEKREKSYNELISRMPEDLRGFKVIKAAEVLLSPKLDLKDIEKFTLGGSNYILLEMPYVFWTEWVFNRVFDIISQFNVTPIIAHLERYLPYQEKTNNILRLMQMEVIPQFNAVSICKWPKNAAVYGLIRKSESFLLGSDRHSSKDRYVFSEALKKISRKCGVETIEGLKANSVEILSNIPFGKNP